jgi:hypothetical protein
MVNLPMKVSSLQRSAHFAAKRSFCSEALILQRSAHFAAKRSFCSEALISQKGWRTPCKMDFATWNVRTLCQQDARLICGWLDALGVLS